MLMLKAMLAFLNRLMVALGGAHARAGCLRTKAVAILSGTLSSAASDSCAIEGGGKLGGDALCKGMGMC
jgi:hypothetical protein